ncbi:MAG: class I SAM-dependent methyltransferase [Planctomycetota bacterium]
MVDEIQVRHGAEGGLFEIGAFHGKSTLLLGHLVGGTSQALGVCDCFGVDDPADVGRGLGFHGDFMRTMRGGLERLDFMRVFIKPSTQLTEEDTTRQCRLFHIDGDHAAESVCHDLKVAADAVHEEGVAILDDIYNFAWPGVAEGFFQFMRERPGEFVPLSIGFNKLVLCRAGARAMYAEWLADAPRCWEFIPRGPLSIKTTELCGHETFVFHIPSYKSPDPMRTTLSMLHHHAPVPTDRLSRLVRYHARAGAC